MTDFRALCEELMNEAIYLGELPYEQDMNPELLARVQAALTQPEPEGPTELIRALELAEAALADIGDAERESGDDLAWAEARAAQVLPRIRAVLARWGK